MACHRSPRRLLAATVLAAAPGLAASTVVPPAIIQTTEAQFPAALAQAPVSRGAAEVMINIDADGRLADLLVTGYTREEFADEAVRTLRACRFEPARRDRQPVGVRLQVKFDFSARGKVASLTVFDTIEARMDSLRPARMTELLCRAAELDRPPVPVSSVAPRHPGTLPGSQEDATVVLDYLIDETGRPRMPIVLEATRDGYAVQAVDALSQWQFAPPTRGGQPVAVRVQQRFVFKQDI